jgi:hypothetical protein
MGDVVPDGRRRQFVGLGVHGRQVQYAGGDVDRHHRCLLGQPSHRAGPARRPSWTVSTGAERRLSVFRLRVPSPSVERATSWNAAEVAAGAREPVQSPTRVDRFFRWIERLPGPPELVYGIVGVSVALGAQAIIWASGAYPFGSFDLEVVQPPLLGAFLLGLTHLLSRVGASAFEDFRPALDEGPEDERLRRQLTSVPDRVALVAMVVAGVVVLLGFILFVAPYAPVRPLIVEVLTSLLWLLAAACAGLFIAFDVRQLRAVNRLSRTAPHLNILKPSTANAFSRLTSVSCVAILLVVAFSMVGEGEMPLPYLVDLSVLAILGVASFVLPLMAIHRRLEQEKNRLQAEAQDRLTLVLSRIHDAVERDDLARADQLQKMLDALLAERALLERLHTWPWSTTTFRSVASALLLPVVVFVLTRAVDRFI